MTLLSLIRGLMTSSGIFIVSFSFDVRASIKAEVLRSSCPLVLERIFDRGADMLQLSLCRIPGIFTGELRLLCLRTSISYVSQTLAYPCWYTGLSQLSIVQAYLSGSGFIFEPVYKWFIMAYLP